MKRLISLPLGRHAPLAWFAALALPSVAIPASPDSSIQAAVEIAHLSDGRILKGRLESTTQGSFRFRPDEGGAPLPLTGIIRLQGADSPPDPTMAPPAFQVRIGPGDRLSGRLQSLSDKEIRLAIPPASQVVSIPRSGAYSLQQRPGEAVVLADGFENDDLDQWVVAGKVQRNNQIAREGAHSLAIPANDAAVGMRLAEPLTSGKIELSYFDREGQTARARWSLEATFRGPEGPELIRVLLGWDRPTVAVQTLGNGPALAIVPLPRKPGWHRLLLRFGPENTTVMLDAAELAYGGAPGGPLTEFRLGSLQRQNENEGESPPLPPDLASIVDDVRLVKVVEPAGFVEADPSQDEVRLLTGDQLFGVIQSADYSVVSMSSNDQPLLLDWSEVAGLVFRRSPLPSEPLKGHWVRVSWRTGPDRDSRDSDSMEGVLSAIDESSLVMSAPFAGTVTVPRPALKSMVPLGQVQRIVLDPTAHHLGDALSTRLSPPRPEGGRLQLDFTLESPPESPAFLTLDVLQVVGASGDPRYSEFVQRGELLTHAALNGTRFDNLNRHVSLPNDAPLRIRLPIPDGLLRKGANQLLLEQVGTAEEPDKLDNLGVLCIALEWPLSSPDRSEEDSP